MKRLLLFISSLALLVACGVVPAYAADPPLPNQPRPDQFPGLAGLNPAERELLATGVIRWSYKQNPSCSSYGSLEADVWEAMGEVAAVTGAQVIYDPSGPLVNYGNCGVDFTSKAGSPSVIGCLCRGYPYNVQIDFNLVMTAYPKETRISIILHEVLHGILTWNEQYGLDFSPSPNWVDFMNTGPLSRHRFSYVELQRWARTAGPERLNGVWQGWHQPVGPQFIWWCGNGARTLWVAIFAYNTQTGAYRWTGEHVKWSPGCTGANVYMNDWEIPCVNPENFVSIRVGRQDMCVQY